MQDPTTAMKTRNAGPARMSPMLKRLLKHAVATGATSKPGAEPAAERPRRATTAARGD